MRITSISALPLAVADPLLESADQAQEAVVLCVGTDAGIVGVAEIDHPTGAVLGHVDARPTSNQTRGVRDILLGRDPTDPALRAGLLAGNQSSSRRGCGLAVLNAIDVALWDIRAQAAGVPLWKLLWADTARPPEPYITLYTGSGTYPQAIAELERQVERARPLGCSAYKVEPLPECCGDSEVASFVATARSLIGHQATLLVDVYQRYATPEDAAACAEAIAQSGAALLETPLPVDDVRAYERLRTLTTMPIAGAELYESPWEFDALLTYGGIDIAQPWPNRLGVSGTIDVIARARQLDRRVMIAGWNATPIGVLLGLHIAAGLPTGIALEYAPTTVYPDSFALRSIATAEPALIDGRFPLPTSPGLGVELDGDRIAHFSRER